MANQQNSEHDSFAERSIAALNEPEGFQPNAAHAHIRLQGHVASQARSRRVKWTTAAVTAAVVIFVAVSSTSASATMHEGRAIVSMNGMTLEVPYFLYAHWHHLMAMLHGVEAPDFALADASGKTIRLSDYQGKVVLLNFWATWCRPCREEIPGFMELQKEFGDDLVVLGISVDEDGWNSVRPYVDQFHVTYPVMLAEPSLLERYEKMESVPTTFLIGRNGRISRIQSTLASKSDYEGWIKGLVGASLRQINTGQ